MPQKRGGLSGNTPLARAVLRDLGKKLPGVNRLGGEPGLDGSSDAGGREIWDWEQIDAKLAQQRDESASASASLSTTSVRQQAEQRIRDRRSQQQGADQSAAAVDQAEAP